MQLFFSVIASELFHLCPRGGAMLDHSPGQVEGVVDEAGSVANGDDLRDTGSE